MRLASLASATFAFLLSCLAACGAPPATSPSAAPSAAPSAPAQVRILYGTTSGGQTFIRLAAQKKVFERYGVTADVSNAISTTAIAALVSGKVDFSVAGVPDTIQAIAAGAPLRVIAFNNDTNPYALIAQPAVSRVSALKGKSVGIGKKGDTSEISLRLALRSSGVDVDKDLSLREIGNSPARLAALASHQLDAAILDEDAFGAQAKAEGLRVLISLSEQHIPYASGGVHVNSNWAKANEATVVATLKGLIDGAKYFSDPANRAEAIAAVAQDVARDPSDPVTIQAYETAANLRRSVTYPHQDAIDGILETLRLMDPARFGSMTVEQIVDPSYIRAAGITS
jgi:ABC-type nitrate/sulfonate/bicarbonate transport system substrate-binding protein